MKEKNLKGKKIGAFIKISRVGNCFMAGVSAIIGFLIGGALGLSLIPKIILVFLVVVIITASGNMVNDFFDRDVDAIHKLHRKRPIPSGRLSPKEVKYIATICFFTGVPLAYFIEPWCGLIALINVGFLVVYDLYLKKIGFPGNITISCLVASTFLFGNVAAVGGIVLTKTLISLISLAFSTNLAREIIKDVEDIRGDREKRETLPMKIGERKALIIANLFVLIAVALSPLLWFWQVLGDSFIPYIAIIGADIVFVMSISTSRRNAHKAQTIIKGGMLIALVAFVLGVIL